MAKDCDIDILQEIIPELGDREHEAFYKYYEILQQFNSKMNLVSNSTILVAGRRHFADSYHGVKLFESEVPSEETVYDFGSGNGFPGIIFAIMRRDVRVLLIERDRRKAEFLKHVSHSIGLENVKVFCGDVKDVKKGVVNYAISRAMAPMPKMLLECRESMAMDSHLFLFKGEYWTGEFANVPPVLFDFWDVSVKGTYQLAKVNVAKFVIDCKRISSAY